MIKLRLVCSCGQSEDLTGEDSKIEMQPGSDGFQIRKKCEECGRVSFLRIAEKRVFHVLTNPVTET